MNHMMLGNCSDIWHHDGHKLAFRLNSFRERLYRVAAEETYKLAIEKEVPRKQWYHPTVHEHQRTGRSL